MGMNDKTFKKGQTVFQVDGKFANFRHNGISYQYIAIFVSR